MADRILFLKTQVAGYTRKDGTFVRPHTDKRPQPEQIGFQFREPTGGDQVKVFPYASGMSRKRDMHAAIESAAGVGTEIGELSDAGMTRIAEAVAAGKPVFVDSGAFNAFKRAIREGKPENARLDFERVFAKYNELSRRVREHSSEYADHALLMMVAPDVIGDQEATLELIEEHAEQIMDWIEAGHDVIVPFQKGPINQYEAFLRVREALHHLPFVVGIPSAAEALSAADLREMLAHDYKPDRIHVLGAISSKRMEERMAVIRDAYVEDVPGVTADAMVMRSKLHELGGLEGQAKFDKIKEILDRVVPEIWGGTLSKSFLEGNDDDGYFTAAVIFAKADLDQAEKAEDLIRRHRGEPTPEQAKSGNYPKRAMKWQGLTIRIENEAGSIRRGVTESGMEWEVRMTFPYGEFSRTEGVDGDPVDVIVGPDLEAPMVYVVHQRRHGDWENYDEDKVCIGFDSEGSATAAFLSNYNDPRFLGPVTAMPVAEFIAKVKATRKAPAMIKAVQVITRKDGVAQRYHVSDEPKPEDEQMLADDMEAQIQWLEAQATGMGYAGVEDMVANNYPAFETLAAKWREDHPVDVALKSFAEELLKARVGPYIRQGKLVNLAGYEGKSGRAEKAPGQVDLFADVEPAAAPVKQTDTPQFREWFGDSKVVDAEGKPLVVYHGTTADFTEFDPRRDPVNDDGYMGVGSYFITDRRDAENYADMALDNAPGVPRVIAAYLSIKNPYRLKQGERGTYGMSRKDAVEWTDALIEQGYDGVANAAGTEFVAFHPEQIKSAIGNNGDFSKESPVITKSMPILFLKAKHRGDDRTMDMFAAPAVTHIETRTRKDGVVQKYHVTTEKIEAIHQKRQLAEKRDMLTDFLEARPDSPNADEWRRKIADIDAQIGPKKVEKKEGRKEPDMSGWSEHQKAAYALRREYENGLMYASAKEIGEFKRKIRRVAKTIPESDEKAVLQIDNLVTRVWGTDFDPKRADVEFAKPATVTEPRAELIKEHERLVHVLETPSHKDDLQEAKKQAKELEEYKRGGDAPETGGFDPEKFDRERNERIKASRDSGAIHLDQLPMYVESMRGKKISYVHGDEKGTITTVTNRGAIYVRWDTGPMAGSESFITSRDAKDYVVTNQGDRYDPAGFAKQRKKWAKEDAKPKAEAPARKPQADYRAAVRSAKTGPTDDNPRRKFYVTIAREGRGVALLAGPFNTHDEALAMVDRAKEKAYEVDPKSHFDAFGTSGVESDNHKPGVLNDQLGLGVLQPVASDDSHPAPIPRMSIAGLPEGDRERWKALHREQHETRYWHMANLKKEMDRHQGAINRAIAEYDEQKAAAEDPLMQLEPSRAAAHKEAADKAFKRYEAALAKKEAAVSKHKALHARMTALGKEKDKIAPRTGDLDYVWSADRYRDTAESQDYAREAFKDYADHYRSVPAASKVKVVSQMR